MQRNATRTLSAMACAAACCLALSGCAGAATSPADEAQQANRAYMSQVNEAMGELDADLDQFQEAVSRGDVVNMRTQADNAYKVLDSLSEAEAPEALAGIRESYVEGTGKLREALDGYIGLYTAAATAGADYDWDSYDKELAAVQKLYDEGVAALEAGDKAASEL